jgi:hypothetical protein
MGCWGDNFLLFWSPYGTILSWYVAFSILSVATCPPKRVHFGEYTWPKKEIDLTQTCESNHGRLDHIAGAQPCTARCLEFPGARLLSTYPQVSSQPVTCSVSSQLDHRLIIVQVAHTRSRHKPSRLCLVAESRYPGFFSLLFSSALSSSIYDLHCR